MRATEAAIGSSPLARGLRPTGRGRRERNRIIPARAGFTTLHAATDPKKTDHPRSRGVYTAACRCGRWPPGSSPLARGLPEADLDSGPYGGIIPARAGFTCAAGSSRRSERDHPRSRGVYWDSRLPEETAAGSSPLARGLPRPVDAGEGDGGIIPARAGFTCGQPGGPVRGADHPRSRGVYESTHSQEGPGQGSSPLARGLPFPRTTTTPGMRIIPARAGFTLVAGVRAPARADHPRSRGVYPPGIWGGARSAGSSPLARGLRHRDTRTVEPTGIIPARAGFTGDHLHARQSGPDHPRSRGVYAAPHRSSPTSLGSSPLARGLRETLAEALTRARIIPARAGFTGRRRARRLRRRDHPRSRGVYSWRPPPAVPGWWIIPARAGFTQRSQVPQADASDHPRSRGVYGWVTMVPIAALGSSPLARGLRRRPVRPSWARGIIPARAGFTLGAPRPMAAMADHPRSRGVYTRRRRG